MMNPDGMKVFYGLTNYSQFTRLPSGIDIIINARWLMKSKSARRMLAKHRNKFSTIMLDSGAFGAYFYGNGYHYSPDEYLGLVKDIQPDLWVTMDIPCEPNLDIGLSTRERIERTVEHTAMLHGRFPNFISVIQGWKMPDYLYCLELLKEKSLLTPVIAMGSLCARKSPKEICRIMREVWHHIPRTHAVHGFGVKISALSLNNGELRNYLNSIDTSAWQFNIAGRGHNWRISKCAEIPMFFARYRKRLEEILGRPYQLQLI